MLSRKISFLVVAFSVVGLVLGAAGVTQAATLIGNWTLNDASGSVVDSIAGHNGTAVGTVTYRVAGPVGYGINFGGTGDFTVVDGTSSANAPFSGSGLTTGSVSLCNWATFTAIPSGSDDLMVSTNNNNDAGYQMGVQGYGASIEAQMGPHQTQIKVAQSSSSPTPPFPLSVNTWYQVTSTYNSSTGLVSLYLDGVSIGTASGSSGAVIWSGGQLNLGATLPSGQQYLGSMADIGIWDGVLSNAQAAAIYNTPVLFGLGTTNQYGLGTMSHLFSIYAAQTGTYAVGGQTWQYDASVPGGHTAGQAWTTGGTYYVQLGTSDGVETVTVPEPSTLVLLGAGLLGLLCYAWRKRP